MYFLLSGKILRSDCSFKDVPKIKVPALLKQNLRVKIAKVIWNENVRTVTFAILQRPSWVTVYVSAHCLMQPSRFRPFSRV
jgi:hypothetical protein